MILIIWYFYLKPTSLPSVIIFNLFTSYWIEQYVKHKATFHFNKLVK